MSFQKSVSLYPAIGVEGDFASNNPQSFIVGSEGAYLSNGCTIGRFCWITGDLVASTGSGVPDGPLPRQQMAIIRTSGQESKLTLDAGDAVGISLLRSGDMLVKATVVAAVKGNKAFAKLTDGTVQFAAAGATVSGFIETAWTCTRACLVNELAVIEK